jgi:hypothetical protein
MQPNPVVAHGDWKEVPSKRYLSHLNDGLNSRLFRALGRLSWFELGNLMDDEQVVRVVYKTRTSDIDDAITRRQNLREALSPKINTCVEELRASRLRQVLGCNCVVSISPRPFHPYARR